ncbi:MAG: FAD:protein FMN transferase [Clostridiales Family XIII bacterium]|nr:FAD:protein FMN transferase [Clostridiales Family XIII bacterium]
MGTFVTVGIGEGTSAEIDAVFNHVFVVMHKTVDMLNHYDPYSEIGRLNANGKLPHASADTLAVLQKALSFAALTEGVFDISVMPYILLWRTAARLGIPPTEDEIEAARASVDYRNISIEGDSVRFLRPCMKISLAGIAKGFVVDKAISVLRDMGVTRAMVNGGGDVRVISGADEPPWRIGVRNPLRPKHLLYAVEAHDLAVASSGSYAHTYNDIINPGTGLPAEGVAGASVISCKAAYADALATALTVLDPTAGIRLFEKLDMRQSAALIVGEDGAQHTSSDWANYT